MANAFYPAYLQTLLDPSHGGAGAVDLNSDTIKARLLSSSTAWDDTDQFLADLTDGAALGTDQTLTTPTVVGGVFDADDPTWSAVPTGDTVAAYVIYKATGSDATSDLIAWFDHDGSDNPISIVTNDGDITFTLSGSGIFAL